MKKLALICGLIALMTTSCALFNQNKEEKFVNPLFYNPLIPIGWTTQTCVLLENKQDYIVLKCSFYNPVIQKMQTNINKFQISECSDSAYCISYHWLVELIEYDENNFRRSGEMYGIE